MIHIDKRIGSKELRRFFKQTTKLCLLPFADFSFLAWQGADKALTVGVERKTLPDFLNSTLRGRLCGHQIPGMQRTYEINYVVIEGERRVSDLGHVQNKRRGRWADVRLGNRLLSSSGFFGMVNTIQVLAGVYVVFTKDKRETAALVEALYGWWSKPEEAHTSHLTVKKKAFDKMPLTKATLCQRVASELPGIGLKRSAAVAKHFKTVEAMAWATSEEWGEVEGVGAKTATKVYNELRGL